MAPDEQIDSLLMLVAEYGATKWANGGAAVPSPSATREADACFARIKEEVGQLTAGERERCAALVESRSRHKLPECTCDFCTQSVNDAAAIRKGDG